MCSFGSCQTRFEFLSQFRKVRNAFAKNQMRLAYEDKRDLYCIVEDEFHVLLVCQLFHEIRVKYTCIYANFRHAVPSEMLLIQLCLVKNEPIIKDLVSFTYHMFKIHDDFNCTL